MLVRVYRRIAIPTISLGIGFRSESRRDNRRMYVPAHFKPDDDDVRELLRLVGAAQLITSTAEGLLATMLPLVYEEPSTESEPGGWGSLQGHVARNNAQWRVPAVGEALVIVQG